MGSASMVYPQVTHRRGQSPLLQHLWGIDDLAFGPRKERDKAAVHQPKTVMKVATEAGKAAVVETMAAVAAVDFAIQRHIVMAVVDVQAG